MIGRLAFLSLLLGPILSVDTKAGPEGQAEELPLTPLIKSRLVWQNPDGRRLHFDQWPDEKKSRLAEIYKLLGKGEKNLGLKLPSLDNVSKGAHRAYFTADQAFDLYAAQVAHVLHVDANKLVPWELKNHGPAELDVFFASTSYYARILASSNTDYPAGIQPGRDYAEAPENTAQAEFDSDPRIGFDFVTGKSSASKATLVGKDELETLVNLTVWVRDNLAHGKIHPLDNKPSPWLEDRLHAAEGQPVALANYGCHSASRLMADLARSVNIPLLKVRTQENDQTNGHFFNRSHGGLLFGWGRGHPRLLWHTDEIYANPGEPCYPLDKEGALLPPAPAARAYFDQRWLTPAELATWGFVYKLEMVIPNKGFGVPSVVASENRADFGWMAGYWKSSGKSKLPNIMRAEQHYALCGAAILDLSVKKILAAQLGSQIESWKGDFQPNELPPLHTLAEYEERAKLCMKALGGPEEYKKIQEAWKSRRGSNLLK